MFGTLQPCQCTRWPGLPELTLIAVESLMFSCSTLSEQRGGGTGQKIRACQGCEADFLLATR